MHTQAEFELWNSNTLDIIDANYSRCLANLFYIDPLLVYIMPNATRIYVTFEGCSSFDTGVFHSMMYGDYLWSLMPCRKRVSRGWRVLKHLEMLVANLVLRNFTSTL